MQTSNTEIDQAVASVGLRPRRLGYLVRHNNRDQFAKAVKYATTEWGGTSHPIIPLLADDTVPPAIKQVAEYSDVEVLIDFAGVSAELRDRLVRDIGATIIPEPKNAVMEPGIHALVMAPGRSLLGQRATLGNPDKLLDLVALGTVPRDQWSDYKEAGVELEREASEIRLLAAQLGGESLIALTMREYPAVRISGAFTNSLIVYCFPRLSVPQATWFWNMRAISLPELGRTHVVITTPRALRDPIAARLLQDICLAKAPSNPDLFLLGTRPVELDELGRGLGFKKSQLKRLRVSWWAQGRDLKENPLTFLVNIDPRAVLLGERVGGKRRQLAVLVAGKTFTLHFNSPIDFNPRVNGRIRLDLEGVASFDWPKKSEVAKLIHHDASYTTHGLSFLTTANAVYQFDLRVPTPPEVVTAILQEDDWSWSLSDKGRYAQALTAGNNSRARLDALRSKDNLRIVGELVSLTSRKADRIVERLKQSRALTEEERDALINRALSVGAPLWKSVHQLSSDLEKRREDVLPSLAELISTALVRRAFRYSCLSCGLPTEFPLGHESDLVSCPGCGAVGPLVGAGSREPEIVYSINSLLDRAMDQDVVPHLLGLDSLITRGEAVWGVPGADVRSPIGEQREVDILALSRTGLIVGELKPPERFKRPVVREFIRLGSAIGAERVIFGSLGSWSSQLKKMVSAEASQAEIALTILDGQTLQT